MNKILSPTFFTLFIGLYSSLTIIASLIKNYSVFTGWDAYFLISMLILSILAIQKLPNSKFSFKNSWPVLAFLILFIPTSINQIHQFTQKDVWLDEYTQFIHTDISINPEGVSNQAAREQQPPLDYFFSAFSSKIFGPTPFAVRFHTKLFYWLNWTIVPLLLIGLGFHWLGAIFYSLIGLSNPFLEYFSLEARPLSLACFLFSLHLLNLLEIYKKKHISQKDFWLICLSTFLFINSISFQTGIYLLLFFSFFTFFSYFHKKAHSLKLFSAHALVAFLILPITYNIIIKSQKMNQFKMDFWDLIPKVLSSFSLNERLYFLKYQLSLYPYYKFLGGFLVLYIIWIFVKQRRKLGNESFVISLILTHLFYPLTFFVVFKSLINWTYFPRYHLIFEVSFALSICFITQYLIERWKPFFQKSTIFTLSILFSLLLPGHFQNPITEHDFNYKKIQYSKLYSKISKNYGPETMIFNFPMNKIGDWRKGNFVSSEIYYKKPKREQAYLLTGYITPYGDSIPYVYPQLKKLNHKRMVLLIDENREKAKWIELIKNKPYIKKISQIEGVTFIEIPIEETFFLENYFLFLNDLFESDIEPQRKIVLTETLLHYLIHKNRMGEAIAKFQWLKNYPLPASIINLDQSQFDPRPEHENKVAYFEELMADSRKLPKICARKRNSKKPCIPQ